MHNRDHNGKQPYEPISDVGLVAIFQRGRPWWANFQLNGKQRRKSLKTASKKEARRRALLLEAELVQGSYQADRRPPRIEEVVAAYLKYARTEDRAAKTITKYTEVFGRVIELASDLGRTNILGIDLGFVDEYRHQRTAKGRAPKTIYNETMIIRQLVNFAGSRRMIQDDPLQGIKIKEPKPRPQPCWSPTEVELILVSSQGPQRSQFTVLADTGKRFGELRWLTWDDVDFEHNVIRIRPKEGWKPKTGDQRAIPMTDRVRSLLEARPRQHSWVFTSAPSAKYPQGGHQLSERHLLRSLKRVLKKLELRGHLHTFRHSFISAALLAGTPEAVVRSWVGHVDREVLKLYTHIANADSQSAMKRLTEAQTFSSNSNPKEHDHGQNVKEDDSAQSQHTGETPKDDQSAN